MQKEFVLENQVKNADLKSKQVIFGGAFRFFIKTPQNVNKKDLKVAKEILSEIEKWELEYGNKDFSMLKNNSVLVAYLAYKFGELVGLSGKALSDVYISGLVSDIGKMYICGEEKRLAYEYVNSPLKKGDHGFENILEALKLFPFKTKRYLEVDGRLNPEIIKTSFKFHSVYSNLFDENFLKKEGENSQLDSVLWFANSLSALSFSSIEGLQRNYSKDRYVTLFEGLELLRQQAGHKAPEFWDKASGAALMGVFLTMIVSFSSPSKASAANYESGEVVSLLNEYRRLQDLEPLEVNEKLAEAAMDKARDMLEKGYWSHSSPSGDTPWKFIREKDYKFIAAGENLARGFKDISKMNDALIASPEHKKNIVDPKYEDIGIAVMDGVMDGKEVTLVVQLFGKEDVSQTKDLEREEKESFSFKAFLEKIGLFIKG